ncbi:heterokaryon incompatibility protein-domain-containing protein [Plectosphaerella plurivora]|uniref:Heterokaryon incompatibility protein-domain-containing protein n=1 Tax=Plectosphaerella plurivora TaxID=936078 RepID=A0A9P9A6V0_9PEZI|nr:heterokaryon incompatibility protein-domain-containing protein [Plectosphaerella plurivora]
MALWFVVKWFLRFYFLATDWIAETTHSSLRNLETWESSISQNRVAVLHPYTYRPLDPLTRDIRILRLRRRTAYPDIVCDFVYTAVDTAPHFEAISYTWGGESMTENIVVDGARVAVTPTVSRWLRYRRSFFSKAYLWIDAVCIDQANKEEKSAQIPLMGDIYSKADRTAVWLTHPADVTCRQANGARTLLMTLNALHMSGATTKNLQYMLQDKSTPYLQQLLAQPYFHRIWVIQEIALAKQVHLFYGTVTMNWDALAYAASVLHDGRLVGSLLQARASSSKRDSEMTNIWTSHISNMAGIAQIRRACLEGVKMEFSHSLAKTGSFTATVPHDNLFGLLGLVDDLPGSIVQPDYNEPLEKLYTRTTRHILEKPSQVSLLQLAGSGFPGAAHQQGLPSWVPDFGHSFNNRRKVYDADSSIIKATQATTNPDWNILEVDISAIDTISPVQTLNCTVFDHVQPVWEHDLKELESYPPDTSSDTLAHQRDQLQSLIDWYDEANSLAHNNPATTAHYPEDLDIAVTKTLCCNTPDDIQDTTDGTLGVERSRMTINVTRIMCQVYQENIDSTVQELNARIMELCGLTEHEWISVVSPEMNQFFFYLGATAGGKSFCILESGRMAMVPPGSRRGDSVVYIRGQRMPFVVRPARQDGFYELVGGCYVHGIPDVPCIFSLPDMKWHEASIV